MRVTGIALSLWMTMGAVGCDTRPSELVTPNLRGSSFVTLIFTGDIRATNECARVEIGECDWTEPSCTQHPELELPKGWTLRSATLSAGSCCQEVQGRTVRADVSGFVRLGFGFGIERPADVDLALDRGPLADPPTVYMVGHVEEYGRDGCE